MIELPTKKVEAKVSNPRFLILGGKPKAGKTSCAAALENNLIIDLEGGSEYLECLSVQARNINDLAEIANALRDKEKELGKPAYDYITIDNATRLEEMCLSYAVTLYKNTPMGKAYQGTDVRTLPNGSGYLYLRMAVRKVIDMFRELAPNFILITHVKESTINKDGEEMSSMSIDLTGKLSDIICGEADAVGYVYRKKNETIISFEGGDNTIREARAPHLRGKKIVITESDENNNLTFHWDKIYLPK
ncbi:MAG: AAA family ATPase [Lachnospiraceae bacterium]|nr:AAA family ATPase [Lachnospiraceae bacterium]